MNKLLKETKLLDFSNPKIQALITQREWKQLNDFEKVTSIYNFVRDQIKFGYNSDDNMPASDILEEGYGQCNTKSTLFMALLRAVGIENRIHGFTIDKALQKGAISGIWYKFSPSNILHSWVEVKVNGHWYKLEGLVLDKPYLTALQEKFSSCKTTFCGFGVYTDHFQHPEIEWNLNDTYIQHKGINQDLGLFDTPDEFYAKHQQQLNPLKQWLYQHIVRHSINRNVRRIRERGS